MSINSNNNLLNEILSTIDDLPMSKEEQEKSITIIENGTTEVTPDENKTLSKVTVNVEVGQSGGDFIGIKWLEVDKSGFPTKAEVSGAPTFNILFYNGTMNGCYKNLEEVIIPSSTTEIGVNAFDRCTNLKKISDISNVIKFSTSCFDRCALLEIDELPKKLVYIEQYAMRGCVKNQFDEMPATVESIGAAAFNDGWKNSKLIFKGTPQTIANNAFMNNTNITDIYCPWAEGAVENAPWGATNATIHYNTTFDENGNPIATEV